MKSNNKIRISFILFIFLSHFLNAQNYGLQGDVQTITWIGYGEIGNFEQKGTILINAATLIFDEQGQFSGHIDIDMNSLKHSDDNLSAHLKDADFFHVNKYPSSEFIFKEQCNDVMEGVLRLKGVEKSITLKIDIQKLEDGIFVKGSGLIDRTQFGIKYNSSSYFQDLGSYAIKNEFMIQFDLHFVKSKT
jgi:polyisoprenoid-binding protein YceI